MSGDRLEHPLRVEDVQAHFESIYDFRLVERAEAFVVSRETASRLGGTGRAEEELLVHEDGDALELALFLAPELLAALNPYSMTTLAPALRTYTGALDAYCQVAEGVSHFMYLARTAGEGRTVSLLELEAQAEVDKFASCLLHRWGAGDTRWAQTLQHRLFEDIHFSAQLSPAEKWRYEEANRLARGYCRRLTPFVSERRLDRLLTALRYSYRLGAEAKLQHWSHDS